MALLGASQLKLYYADLEIFSNVTVQVNEKAHIGIVGPNGSGKSSFIKVLLGLQDFHGGEVFKSDSLRIGYVPQTALQNGSGTIEEEIMTAFSDLIQLEESMAESALRIQNSHGDEQRTAEREYASLVDSYESRGGYDYHNLMERVVQGVGLTKDNMVTLVSDASGGERTRAALATALLTDPDLLILDEPTNYLDFNGLEWLENFLKNSKNAYIVISHDRFFLDSVATEIWDIENAQLKSYPGNYSKYKKLKSEEEDRQEKEFIKQQEYIKREESIIARYHAGQRSKEARGRARKLARIEKIQAPSKEDTVHMRSSNASRTGEIVLSTHNLKVGFKNDPTIELFSIPDTEIHRGSTTAIIGNNGIGKTTLLKTILGETPALSGSVRLGHNVKTGYFRQGSDEIPGHFTVMDALLEIKNISIGEARSFLARFLFSGEEIYDKVETLSGGERGRLALARLLITEPNVLILDEPTTHLDIKSREALEQMIKAYDGTTIFVSHDRQLISFLADSIWSSDGKTVSPFEGGFSEWFTNKSKNPTNSKHSPKKTVNSNTKQKRHRQSEKSSTPKSNSKQIVDYETLINELEGKVLRVESELQSATNTSDVDKIIELGHEHNKLTQELEKLITKWSE